MIEFQTTRDGAVFRRSSKEAAAFDLAAMAIERDDKHPGIWIVATGIAVALPRGFCGLLMPRSSTGLKRVRLANTVGLIDPDYRGEIVARIEHHHPSGVLPFEIGDRVVQLLVVPFLGEAIQRDRLPQTERGAGGFGSTGK